MTGHNEIYQVIRDSVLFWEGPADSEDHALYQMLCDVGYGSDVSWDGEHLAVSWAHAAEFGSPWDSDVRIRPTVADIELDIVSHEPELDSECDAMELDIVIDGMRGWATLTRQTDTPGARYEIQDGAVDFRMPEDDFRLSESRIPDGLLADPAFHVRLEDLFATRIGDES